MKYLGELAGLSTAALWAFTSIFFSEAGKRIGSFFVNKIRLIFAVLIYMIILLVTTGSLIPANINSSQVFWLGLSGIIGLVFGDSCGFKALVMIGPRLTTMFYATAPIFTTIIAWLFLGENLGPYDLIGISMTVGGVLWVVSERKNRQGNNSLQEDHPDHGSLLKGSMYGLGAALGQAVGLVIAKHAMSNAGGTVEPLEASYVRIVFALVTIWMISGARGQLKSVFKAMKNLPAVGFSAAGAVVGPFLGVWMSLVAIKYIPTGIAATLNAMTPVMILPLLIWWYKEDVTPRAWIGAIVAVAGVAMLFIS